MSTPVPHASILRVLAAGWPRRIGLAAAAALVCAGCATAPSGDAWWGRDKACHLVGAGIIAGAATAAAADGGAESRDVVVGIGVAIGCGLGKEAWDLRVRGTGWSWRDLAWDLIGAALGSALAAQAAD